jgi:hypothetical protein
VSGRVANFNLTFEFNQATIVDGMFIWNYVYRNATSGSTSPLSGVKEYSLTFYSGSGATGSVYSGTLQQAQYNALNMAQAMIAAQSDPEVVIVLINHALGSSAIQWWSPRRRGQQAGQPAYRSQLSSL